MNSHASSSRSGKRPSTSIGTSVSSRTAKSSAYDAGFAQSMIDNNMYPDEYEFDDGRHAPRPGNYKAIMDRMHQPRPSLSPSRCGDEHFRQFKRVNAHARDEKDMMANVVPIITGPSTAGHLQAQNKAYTNMAPMAPGHFTRPQPDLYYGSRPSEIDPRVRQDLDGMIIPSNDKHYPAVPNFFVEVKGPDGSAAVVRRQVGFVGAIGARGMHALQSYSQSEREYNGNAHSFSSTYNDGTLKMYTHHLESPVAPGGQPQSYMTQLNSHAMTGNPETFRQGIQNFRNLRDLAKDDRTQAITRANEKARSLVSLPAASTDTSRTSNAQRLTRVSAMDESSESETSADELALDQPGPSSQT